MGILECLARSLHRNTYNMLDISGDLRLKISKGRKYQIWEEKIPTRKLFLPRSCTSFSNTVFLLLLLQFNVVLKLYLLLHPWSLSFLALVCFCSVDALFLAILMRVEGVNFPKEIIFIRGKNYCHPGRIIWEWPTGSKAYTIVAVQFILCP